MALWDFGCHGRFRPQHRCLFSFQRDLMPAIIVTGLLGCANITYAGSQSNLIQAYCPDHLRGRVMGLMVACFHTTLALGTLLFGTLGVFVGISNAREQPMTKTSA